MSLEITSRPRRIAWHLARVTVGLGLILFVASAPYRTGSDVASASHTLALTGVLAGILLCVAGGAAMLWISARDERVKPTHWPPA